MWGQSIKKSIPMFFQLQFKANIVLIMSKYNGYSLLKWRADPIISDLKENLLPRATTNWFSN